MSSLKCFISQKKKCEKFFLLPKEMSKKNSVLDVSESDLTFYQYFNNKALL